MGVGSWRKGVILLTEEGSRYPRLVGIKENQKMLNKTIYLTTLPTAISVIHIFLIFFPWKYASFKSCFCFLCPTIWRDNFQPKPFDMSPSSPCPFCKDLKYKGLRSKHLSIRIVILYCMYMGLAIFTILSI